MPRLFSPADLSGILEKPATRPSARAMALAADLKCLCYLARFGHLTTASLAAAIWPNIKYGQDMAARTLRRLSASGVELAASRHNASGGPFMDFDASWRRLSGSTWHRRAPRHGFSIDFRLYFFSSLALLPPSH